MKKTINYLILLVSIAGISAGTSYMVSKKVAVKKHEAQATPDIANARKWIHEATLSGEQLEKLEPIEAALKRDLDSLQIVLAKERLVVCSIFRTAKPTEEQLKSHVQRIAQLESAQQELIIKHLIAMSEILTLDQKDKFFTAMMSDICTGCREGFCKPGTPCMCGSCPMGKGA